MSILFDVKTRSTLHAEYFALNASTLQVGLQRYQQAKFANLNGPWMSKLCTMWIVEWMQTMSPTAMSIDGTGHSGV